MNSFRAAGLILPLFATYALHAQCYKFTANTSSTLADYPPISLSVNIASVPLPKTVMTSEAGIMTTQTTYSGLQGNATLVLGQSTTNFSSIASIVMTVEMIPSAPTRSLSSFILALGSSTVAMALRLDSGVTAFTSALPTTFPVNFSGNSLNGSNFPKATSVDSATVLKCDASLTANLPTISSGAVVPINSTSNTISAGSWISIFGSNLSNTTASWNGDFPLALGGTSVIIDSKPAYLWFVSPTQINLQVPDDTSTGSVNVEVITSAGNAYSTATLAAQGPSFNMLNAKYPAAIVATPGVGNSGSGYDIIGPAKAFSFPSRPVQAGETLLIYGTGFGKTNPAVPAGKAFSGAAPCITTPQFTIGGVPATVTFAGLVGPGLYQFNVVVPDAGSGDKTLQAVIGGATTPNNVLIALQ